MLTCSLTKTIIFVNICDKWNMKFNQFSRSPYSILQSLDQRISTGNFLVSKIISVSNTQVETIGDAYMVVSGVPVQYS